MLTDKILDADTVQALPQEFRGYGLHLDCGAALSITAGGLGQLVTWHLHLQSQGGHLTLLHVGEELYELFEVTRLTRVLDVRPAAASSPWQPGGPPERAAALS